MRAATTASPKPATIERWENGDGEVPSVQTLSPVEALEHKGRRGSTDPAIFLLSKTRSKRNDPLT
jgi:hypothetical protein